MSNCLATWLSPFDITAPSVRINELHTDNRTVGEGDVFIALSQQREQVKQHTAQAIKNKVAAVLIDEQFLAEIKAVESYPSTPIIGIKALKQQHASLIQAYYADAFNAMQSGSLPVLAVTGTNGKTSVTQLIAQILLKADKRVGVIGTMGEGIYPEFRPTLNTTPGIAENLRIITRFLEEQADVVCMEVSSHALDQGRVAGFKFVSAAITNITHDHLDYHETFEHYATTKQSLFTSGYSQKSLLNLDDALINQWYQQGICSDVMSIGRVSTDTTHSKTTLGFSDVIYHPGGIRFNLHIDQQCFAIESPLFGGFNIYNLMTAIGQILQAGLMSMEDTIAAIKTLSPVAGRAEPFPPAWSKGAGVIVDYAHTPDALEKMLTAAREHTTARLICVFGCGGDRDKEKRPAMGEIAAKLADFIIVTNDNPRSESPDAIAEQVVTGIPGSKRSRVEVILDRVEAIKYGLSMLADGDVLVIAGKGHETYQEFACGRVEYDERALVRELTAQTSAPESGGLHV